MIIENLTTLKINQLTKAQYEAALAAGTVNENELYMTEETNVDLTDFALKPTITTTTLLVSNWDSTAKTYSFEATYPSARYDIEIALDSTATEEQAEVLNGEIHILGSSNASGTHKKHYKWDGSAWTSVRKLPYDFANGKSVVLNNEINILDNKTNGTNHHVINVRVYREVA